MPKNRAINNRSGNGSLPKIKVVGSPLYKSSYQNNESKSLNFECIQVDTEETNELNNFLFDIYYWNFDKLTPGLRFY